MLDVDGQTVQYRYDAPRAQLLVWPGPSPGQASLLFEEGGGAGPSRSYQAPGRSSICSERDCSTSSRSQMSAIG